MTSEADLIAQAVSEGYPDIDETCSACGDVFKNYHHFTYCNEPHCPMRDPNSKSLFEPWREKEEEEKEKQVAVEDGKK